MLVPPFEAAFHAHMAAWRLDGKPRTAAGLPCTRTAPCRRRKSDCSSSSPTQDLRASSRPGRLFGMGQSKANQWIHVLLPVLLAALRTLGDAPGPLPHGLAQRLGVTEADAATVVTPLAEEPPPIVAVPAVEPASPFCPRRDGTVDRPPPRPC